MYQIRHSKRYKRKLRKLDRSGRQSDIIAIEKVVKVLASGNKLPRKYFDHALSGHLQGLRECHIKPDLLLMYRKHNDVLVLVLVETGESF